jgi:DNA polymerase V
MSASHPAGVARPEQAPPPLFVEQVAAGFPSPAEDYIDQSLDLNELLVRRPAATFFVRASGDSMIGAGIHSGDILVVDRSLEPANGRIVVAVINAEMTVKRIRARNGRLYLDPDNGDFAPIEVTKDMDFEVWGVVQYVIHKAG